MKREQRPRVLAALAVVVVAVLMVSSPAPLQPEDVDGDLNYKRLLIDDGTGRVSLPSPFGPGTSGEPSLPGTSDDHIKPIEIRDDPSQIDDLPSMDELHRLSDLEGRQEFQNLLPYNRYRSYWDCGLILCYDAVMEMGVADMYGDLDRDMDDVTRERDIEEADLVKLIGNTLYILNPYRGLIIVDLSRPDVPVILGGAPVIGSPVDMDVVGDRAFIVTSADYNFWYKYMSWQMEEADGWTVPTYHIGSKVTVVDVSLARHPRVLNEVGIEGFITDSRRVGDVIYYVSTVNEWYLDVTNQDPAAITCVMSLNLADPSRIFMVDKETFEGNANQIHATRDHLFVAQPTTGSWWGDSYTDISLVDISDPWGDIKVRGRIAIDGIVNDRFQMDYYDDTFRVVSHFFKRPQESKLWIINLDDPEDMFVMGSLLIDDAGTLHATRFAGERGYTVHLPERSIDPLDVLDLSDPYNPVLCDVFEMPGWVTHMEVRGMKIVAIGVDDSSGRNKVAVSLFDVTDPWNVVMEDRVQLGQSWSTSEANFEPKALTILDDQGLVVIPFTTSTTGSNGYQREYWVQLVEFDLETGDLREAGRFTQPDPVTRTRAVGDYIISTSPMFIQSAYVLNRDAPEVTATIELCPNIKDIHIHGGQVAQLRWDAIDRTHELYIMEEGCVDLGHSTGQLTLGTSFSNYFWNGAMLHSYTLKWRDDDRYEVTVTTIDLFDPDGPRLSGSTSFLMGEDETLLTGDGGYYPYYYDIWWGDDLVRPLAYIDSFPMYRPNYYSYSFANPVLVGSDTLVFVASENIYTVNLHYPTFPYPASITPFASLTVVDVRVSGNTLYITDYEDLDLEVDDGNYGRLGEYNLHRFDLSRPWSPVVERTVNIPGTPVGISWNGEFIYTQSTWWFGDDRGRVQTLNVVRLGQGVATLVSALELAGYESVTVADDRAFIQRISRVEAAVAQGGRYVSTLEVIELLRPGGPVPTDTVVLPDSSARIRIVDGYVILTANRGYGIWAYRVDLEGELRNVGYFVVNNQIDQLYVHGTQLMLVQGSYGVSVLELEC